MPMGIVSDSDFQKERLNVERNTERSNGRTAPETSNPTNSKPSAEIIDVTRGRPTGAIEVPNGLRKLIGEESAVNGRQSALELAQSLGISPSSVSAYNAGATSTATYDRTPNRPHIDAAKSRVADKARGRLMSALRHISKDKLESASARDLAGIAKDMSAIVRNMEPETPKSPGEGANGPTFIFYSPQIKKEEHYDIVKAVE